jgi:hypothetical protein
MKTEYGWLIKHERTGQYITFKVERDGFHRVAVVGDPDSAELFPSRTQALDTLTHLARESSTFPVCDVVDYTRYLEKPAERPPEHVPPTRDELVRSAIAAGKERRERHAAARAAARQKPTARLNEKPPAAPPPAPRKKTTRKPKSK